MGTPSETGRLFRDMKKMGYLPERTVEGLTQRGTTTTVLLQIPRKTKETQSIRDGGKLGLVWIPFR